MDVNSTAGVADTYQNTVRTQTNETGEAKQQAAVKAETGESVDEGAVVYEKTQQTKYVPDKSKIEAMIKESENTVNAFKKMIEKLLERQGKTYLNSKPTGTIDFSGFSGGMVEIDEETRKAAQEAISEDGYYGVKNTSQRILDFARALSGGDPSKIDLLQKAVEDGFNSVAELWGGMDKLPQITKDTHAAVMKGFEEWRNSAASEA